MSEAEPQSELSTAAKTPPFVSPTTVRLINQMRERLECRICMDLMRSEIASLPCQHCFCKMCIETWLAQQKRCPVCNAPAGRRGAHKNVAMEQLVSVFGRLSASIAQEKTKVEVLLPPAPSPMPTAPAPAPEPVSASPEVHAACAQQPHRR